MSRFSDPDFKPDEIARELRERMRPTTIHIDRRRCHWNGEMRRAGHVVTVDAWKDRRTGAAETIMWLDGVEVLRKPEWMSHAHWSAAKVAADIIVAAVATEVQP